MKNSEKLINLKNSLSYVEQDELYRMLWAERVKEDVMSFCDAKDYSIDDGQLEIVVERYVYDGDYDCYSDHWTNIENLVRDVVVLN